MVQWRYIYNKDYNKDCEADFVQTNVAVLLGSSKKVNQIDMCTMLSSFLGKRKINFKNLIASWVDVGANSVGVDLPWGKTGSYQLKEKSGFQISIVKPKQIQFLTKLTTQLI